MRDMTRYDMDDGLDEPNPWDRWQCPCPECNGAGPRCLDPDPADADAMLEPEHPENVSPGSYRYG